MMAARKLGEHTLMLRELLHGLAEVSGAQDVPVTGLCSDSRALRQGDVFIACAGIHSHGLAFASEAVARGASAIVWEPVADTNLEDDFLAQLDLPAVAVEQLSRHLGSIAERFHGNPSRELYTVGVTGTDGKTSVTHFVAGALHALNRPCGLIGTLGYGLFGQIELGMHTTPDPLRLHQVLADVRNAGGVAAAMEVSSHALHQARVDGVEFDVAVLTNFSRDHLDYHGDLNAYAAAKSRLFELRGLRHAVINADDTLGMQLLATVPAHLAVTGYSLHADQPPPRAYRERWLSARVHSRDDGLTLHVRSANEEGELRSPLLGRFNAANLLAAFGVLRAYEISFADALNSLAGVRTVPGRMEPFQGGARQPLVVVDYAHTPRALEQVLRALRAHCRGRLWCVFGAGGDRDTGKRPLMGGAAETLADCVVITDDNPRTENAAEIVEDIRRGMRAPKQARIIHDRTQAIATAIESAGPDDLVLVAGKGHEEVQIVGKEHRAHSDRATVRKLLGEVSA